MIRFVYNDNYEKRLWITPAIQSLISQINLNTIVITLHRVGDSQFTRENPSSNPQDERKPLHNENEQMLRIKYKIVAGSIADSLKNISRIKAISNYNFLHCREICQDKIKRTYIYKHPGFNEAFSSVVKMLPNFTAEEFAYIGTCHDCYNHNLVLESEIENLSYELLRIVESVEITKHYEITLNIIGSDIDHDLKSILNIIQICRPCML